MPEYEEPEYFYLSNLLSCSNEINLIFRTGMYRHIVLKGHQFPLKSIYTETHKTALRRIPLLLHYDGSSYYIMVSANHDGQIQRREYMIKRAILDLQEQYGWEVKVC